MKILHKAGKTLENLNAELVNIIIALLGIILVIIALIVKTNTFWGQVCISTGTSFLASSIVVFISSKYLFKQSKIKEIIEEWGLVGIYETRQNMNPYCNLNLEKNKKQLDIIAFGLKGFRHSKGDLVKDKITGGMKLRIITIYPESEFLTERERAEGCIEGEIKNTINQLIEWVELLKKNQLEENQVQIHCDDTLPFDFYFKLDNSVYVGPYLYGMDSQQTISYEFKCNSKGYHYYSNYFEKVWNNNKLCKDMNK
ncbi:MAG: hypothetical protein WBJ17_09455 [Natronincolaceae bacterium]